jgi:dihydrofolate reductase
MRKIVAGFAISLDGFITGPNNEFDWITVNPEINFAELMKRYDTYLLGRKTYEFSKKGPSFGKDKVYVFSSTLDQVDKPAVLIKNDIKEKVQEIKNDPGKDIALFGGGELLTSFLDMDLVDEISMAVIPVLLGTGTPMVRELQKRILLTLTDTKNYSNGTVQLTYTVNRS